MVGYERGDWGVEVGDRDLPAPRRLGHMVEGRLSVVVTACKYRDAVGTEGEREAAGVGCWSVGVCL